MWRSALLRDAKVRVGSPRRSEADPRRRRPVLVGAVSLLAFVAPATTGRPGSAEAATGTNVHRAGVDCVPCHGQDAGWLAAHHAAAATTLKPDLDAVCAGCHADEGPSHRTGIVAKRPVPPTLPLAADGTITCATCHFVHGEATTSESFERIDNAHGELCLTCHELSELE